MRFNEVGGIIRTGSAWCQNQWDRLTKHYSGTKVSPDEKPLSEQNERRLSVTTASSVPLTPLSTDAATDDLLNSSTPKMRHCDSDATLAPAPEIHQPFEVGSTHIADRIPIDSKAMRLQRIITNRPTYNSNIRSLRELKHQDKSIELKSILKPRAAPSPTAETSPQKKASKKVRFKPDSELEEVADLVTIREEPDPILRMTHQGMIPITPYNRFQYKYAQAQIENTPASGVIPHLREYSHFPPNPVLKQYTILTSLAHAEMNEQELRNYIYANLLKKHPYPTKRWDARAEKAMAVYEFLYSIADESEGSRTTLEEKLYTHLDQVITQFLESSQEYSTWINPNTLKVLLQNIQDKDKNRSLFLLLLAENVEIWKVVNDAIKASSQNEWAGDIPLQDLPDITTLSKLWISNDWLNNTHELEEIAQNIAREIKTLLIHYIKQQTKTYIAENLDELPSIIDAFFRHNISFPLGSFTSTIPLIPVKVANLVQCWIIANFEQEKADSLESSSSHLLPSEVPFATTLKANLEDINSNQLIDEIEQLQKQPSPSINHFNKVLEIFKQLSDKDKYIAYQGLKPEYRLFVEEDYLKVNSEDIRTPYEESIFLETSFLYRQSSDKNETRGDGNRDDDEVQEIIIFANPQHTTASLKFGFPLIPRLASPREFPAFE